MSTTDQTSPILLTSLLEGLLDQYQADAEKQKIDSLRKQIEDERLNLAKIRHAQQRRKELERIRKQNEKESKQSQTEQKLGTVPLLNQKGQLIGWIQTLGMNRVNILNPNGKVVAREIDGRTFDGRSKFQGFGRQGIRLLEMRTTQTRQI